MGGNQAWKKDAIETGGAVASKVAASAADPPVELMRLINAFQVSQALHVAAELGVADHLKDGPQPSDALAQACGAHPGSLYRLLRALAAVGVFQEAEDRRFSLTPLGACLTGDAPGSRRDYARWIGTPGLWRSWGNLLHSIRTGEGAALFTFRVDAWTYRAEHSDERAVFDAAMTGLSLTEAGAILKACDFGRFGCIVDIGGGEGHLLKAILLACRRARGVLFDQPQVTGSAEQVFAAAGLLDRCQAVSGDFFQVIPGGGDAYVMKSVLHAWDDGAAAMILANCRNAMPPAAMLLVN